MGIFSGFLSGLAILCLISFSLSTRTFAAAASTAFRVPMNYMVPVPMDRPELLPFAKFTNGFIELKKMDEADSADRWIANYQLPLVLTGRPISVEMKQLAVAANHLEAKNQIAFAGENADMTCSQNACGIQFRNLELDSKEVEKFIRSHFPPAEIESRLAVAARFDLDPGGVIELLEELPQLNP